MKVLKGGTDMKRMAIIVLLILASNVTAPAVEPTEWTAPDTTSKTQILPCSTAVPIEVGELVTADNSGLVNGANLYSCQYWDIWGGEHIYELTVPEAGVYGISLRSEDCDQALLLLDECYRFAECLGFSDSEVTGVESISAALSPGVVYYIVVDAYELDSGCSYDLMVQPFETVSGNDRCDDTPMVCLEPTRLPHSIYVPVYDPGVINADHEIRSCGYMGTWIAPDVAFVLAMSEGDELTLKLHTGFSVVVLTDDCSAASCLAYAYTGNYIQVEEFTYTHTGDYQLLYLIVSTLEPTYHPEVLIEYTHTGDCGLAVANENASWGEVKSLYR